jgi:two-component system, sensor histidine kinase and response regulator
MQSDREQCLSAGMDGYVSKPLRPQQMFAEIERLTPVVSSASARSDAPPEPFEGKAPALDTGALLRLLSGDRDLARELAAVFPVDATRLLGEIRAAMASGDAPAVRFAAHTLKGSAASLRAGRTAESAHRIERLAAGGDVGDAALEYDVLERELSAALGVLARLEDSQ